MFVAETERAECFRYVTGRTVITQYTRFGLHNVVFICIWKGGFV